MALKKSLFLLVNLSVKFIETKPSIRRQLTVGLLLPSLFDILARVFDIALGIGGVKLPPDFATVEKEECCELGWLLDTLV